MSLIVDEIFALFARHGAGRYGEDLSLGEHMLQTAALAGQLGAPRPVIAAALLHDIGYFLEPDSETSIRDGRDFAHESLAASWLSLAFDAEVTAPVALHVAAKRYLCAVEPGYHAELSEASRLSLALQGGLMRETEAAAFAEHPAFHSALLLRRCDDRGKDTILHVPALEHYRGLLVELAR